MLSTYVGLKEESVNLRWWRRRDSTGLAGVDINADFIKLLKINSAEIPYKVEKFSISPVPQGAIVKDEIKDIPAVSAVLKNMFAINAVNTQDVALAVPRSSIIIKNISIDKRLSPGEIEARAWFEAYHHFPDLVGEIYLDFSVLGPSAEDPHQLELMLVACRKERIKPYLELLKQASLKAKIIDVNSYAFERSLSVIAKEFPELETIALLNLDYHLSSLLVVQKGNLIFSHDHLYDSTPLKNKVEEFLKNKNITPIANQPISLMQNEDEYMNILQEKLGAHLRHTMHFFYSSRPNINIQQIMISGECANLFNLATYIEREIGIEAVVADPFTRMTILPEVQKDQLQANAAKLMLACGLALSKLT
jgi:type IV pilus assembly protein PilM